MSDCNSLERVLEAFVEEDSPAEHRSAQRRPYSREHRFAPYFGEGEPFPTDFQSALCNDISTKGLSFFWPRLPTFKSIVIRLGEANNHIEVIANILWHSREPLAAGYLVGCKFIGRAND